MLFVARPAGLAGEPGVPVAVRSAGLAGAPEVLGSAARSAGLVEEPEAGRPGLQVGRRVEMAPVQ